MEWPEDIVRLIYAHLHACQIQRHARRRFYRHAARCEWFELRRALTLSMSTSAFEALQNCSLVRREWRTEPDSWCYSDIDYQQIILEVEAGLWDNHRGTLPLSADGAVIEQCSDTSFF